MQAFSKVFSLSRCYFVAVRRTIVLSVVEPGGRAANPKSILRTHPASFVSLSDFDCSIHDTQTQTTTQHRRCPCCGLVPHPLLVPQVLYVPICG